MSTAEKLTRPGYLSKSIGLMSTAARAAGVDLGAAMKKGDITAVDYATMVHRCNSSNCARKCEHWRNAEPDATAAPSFCANLEILERLKP
ncbi:hypothetical protein JL2886_03711 [Phaeobacter gallaeciensis]|jgi:hypothetical protein|uniref:DUF6455 family protein n=1 Tax=Phaeobacter gallaeciensis TaxID=60890 RepID=A0A1B0ZWM5_9RHOB|nr:MULTISPECIES: DUF6455 family protein [Phaeobacter]MDF1770461.1 DUF6455 family protein [Pseudophaeobacter sp. bin_em_oilr2.035]MEE2633082.1 DUF6455 family protein [Pseudomonadota bacterium]ANP38583.1 hypothetical protein JL2886_03711 [Phaeobacter gallaeciensis]MDE4062274.1 DUF6455 family protein [Phaeobacter gallaeciensis]MDE4096060.1 DUF6455 family protein [Phaeobacter gallaeciensis]